MHAKKTAFVVEHDFIMATYLADRVIVYEGQASVDATATRPQALVSGIERANDLVVIILVRTVAMSLFVCVVYPPRP